MPSFCSAYGCSNSGRKPDCIGKISFHRFPINDPILLKKWMINIKRDFVPTKHSSLCSLHFEDDCFVYNKCGRRSLKTDALPTKFSFIDKSREKATIRTVYFGK